MNFFEHQDAARRKTRRMVVLFVLAVIGVVAAVDLAIALGWLYLTHSQHRGYGYAEAGGWSLSAIPASVLVWGAVVTLFVILGESLRQTLSLREGGRAVADAFGARRVDPDTHDAKERQLLNVVEEMAIASGVRVPAVYVLDDEEGLNAFAAGHSVSDSIVAVTRGLLDTLNRDELQGVIGHEFSHILNGDMALNIRLIGVLAGIVAIGSIGFFLMRVSSNRNSRNGAPLLFAGLALVIIGYTGLFFARLIKAAVSREREFLADASSVQFTRNPEGIAGALEKLRTAPSGALIHNRYAEEASHMFFGQSIQPWFSGLFDTHPPLEARIERIYPGFELSHRARARIAARSAEAQGSARETGPPPPQATPLPYADIPAMPEGLLGGAVILGLAGAETTRAASPAVEVKAHSAQMADLVGTAGKVEVAHRLLASLPDGLRARVHRPDDACAMVVALMLASREEVRAAQLVAARAAGAALAETALELEAHTRTLAPQLRLPLIDLALPAIKAAAPEAQRRFLDVLEAVIHADRRVSPHEFVVLALVRFQMHAGHGHPPVKFNTLEAVRDEVLGLLSLVAEAGCFAQDKAERQREFEAAFDAGAAKLKLDHAVPAAWANFSMEQGERMLGRLRLLAPLKKAVVVQALFAAILADHKIRVIEAELMRVVCAVLDCPLPPLFDDFDSGKIAG
ncbi:MAG TPA: M48 family metallopeptidase [Gallionellaceae bacterium]|nr:M48 family metallopeptidase [Gallionellaceae bacterium]